MNLVALIVSGTNFLFPQSIRDSDKFQFWKCRNYGMVVDFKNLERSDKDDAGNSCKTMYFVHASCNEGRYKIGYFLCESSINKVVSK